MHIGYRCLVHAPTHAWPLRTRQPVSRLGWLLPTRNLVRGEFAVSIWVRVKATPGQPTHGSFRTGPACELCPSGVEPAQGLVFCGNVYR